MTETTRAPSNRAPSKPNRLKIAEEFVAGEVGKRVSDMALDTLGVSPVIEGGLQDPVVDLGFSVVKLLCPTATGIVETAEKGGLPRIIGEFAPLLAIPDMFVNLAILRGLTTGVLSPLDALTVKTAHTFLPAAAKQLALSVRDVARSVGTVRPIK